MSRQQPPLRVGPPAIMPDDLRTKVLGAEDLIKKRAHQVNRITVAMEEHASVVRDDSAYFAQAFKQEARIFLLRRPKVIKRKLPGAISWGKAMDFLSEKGRVEVRQVHSPTIHLLQDG